VVNDPFGFSPSEAHRDLMGDVERQFWSQGTLFSQ
jgi:hypothetical protein